jgi:hypothetical protein
MVFSNVGFNFAGIFDDTKSETFEMPLNAFPTGFPTPGMKAAA